MTDPLARSGKRTELELLCAQIGAVDAWLAAHGAQRQAAQRPGLTREQRLDAARRAEAIRREHAAIIASVDAHLRAAGDLLHVSVGVRAVIAHRNEWLRHKVALRLADHDVEIIGSFSDGADAAGAVVAEQPDLLLVEDRLPTLGGAGVVARAHALSPLTTVGVQVADSSDVGLLVDTGAHAVFSRRIPPAEIADRLVSALDVCQRPLVMT